LDSLAKARAAKEARDNLFSERDKLIAENNSLKSEIINLKFTVAKSLKAQDNLLIFKESLINERNSVFKENIQLLSENCPICCTLISPATLWHSSIQCHCTGILPVQIFETTQQLILSSLV